MTSAVTNVYSCYADYTVYQVIRCVTLVLLLSQRSYVRLRTMLLGWYRSISNMFSKKKKKKKQEINT